MSKQRGFTLLETMIALAVAAVAIGAVSFGFIEYRRQAAVADAVELVGAVQKAAEQMDPTLPVDVGQLSGAVDVRFRAQGITKDGPNLGGFRGGQASLVARPAGGIELHLSGVDPAACGEIVSRLWPMVDGISAGWAGSKGGTLEPLKQAALGPDQPSAPAAALRRGCVQGAAERSMVIAMVNGFPAAVAMGSDDVVKPTDPVIDPIIDPPPPDTGKK